MKSAETDSIFGKRNGGLRKRWYQNTVGIIIIVILISAIVSCLLIKQYYYSNMQSGLETVADSTGSFIDHYISQNYNEVYRACVDLTNNFDDKNYIELQFIDRYGHLVSSSYTQWSGYRIESQDVTEALETGLRTSCVGRSAQTDETLLSVSLPLVSSNGSLYGILRYVTSLKLANRQIWQACALVCVVAVLLILFVMIGSNFFLKSILEPVKEITATAKRIASGSYGSHISHISNDEIGVLSEAINDMSDAISRTEKMQSEFVSSVSHELRTPLTVIKGWGETLMDMPDMSKEDMERGLSIILSEAGRLTKMVEDLLEFTRVQDGRLTLNVEICDLRSPLEDTIFMYAGKLKSEGVDLEYIENDDDIPEIPCDISRLRQVFLNLLDNAVKHGGAGGKVTVEITRIGEEVSIRVRDFGPGIPEEELPFVKSKFYKGSSKARGNGIGLAVCDEIIRLHNGTLTLSNAKGGGTLVDVRLPIVKYTEDH